MREWAYDEWMKISLKGMAKRINRERRKSDGNAVQRGDIEDYFRDKGMVEP
jgi:hypothetical protein